MLGLSHGKLIGVAAVLVIAAATGWKVNSWRTDAAKLDQVEAQIRQYREDLAEAEALAKVDAEADATLSGLLEDIRRERDIALDELDTRPLTRIITKVIDNDTPCTCSALGADFRLLWNSADPAVRDSAAPPAD